MEKGQHHSEETKRKIGLACKGKKLTPEQRLKLSIVKKGKSYPHMFGNKSRKGQRRSIEEVIKQGNTQKGENNPNWRGGITSNYATSRNKHIRWYRNGVLERDNFICQECGRREAEMQTHHIILVKECIKMNREDLIYDVNNGITLCENCHIKIHSKNKGEKNNDIGN